MVQQPTQDKNKGEAVNVQDWTDQQISRLLVDVMAAKPAGRTATLTLIRGGAS